MKKLDLKKTTIKDYLTRKEGTCIEYLTRKIGKNNTTGVKGVSLTRNGMYVAHIGFKNQNIRLGRFSKLKDAVRAREMAEKKYYEPMINKYRKGGKHEPCRPE